MSEKKVYMNRFIEGHKDPTTTFIYTRAELAERVQLYLSALDLLVPAYIEHVLPRDDDIEFVHGIVNAVVSAMPKISGVESDVTLEEIKIAMANVSIAVQEWNSVMHRWIGIKSRISIMAEEG